ncbi:MAG: site-specific integrase [Chitinophagales bacterium]
MVNQASIKFFPRKDQILDNGEISIYVRVILNRDKFDFSTRQSIRKLSDWDQTTMRVKNKTPVNSVLNEIEHDINEAYSFLKYHNKPLTISALRRQLRGDKTVRLRLTDFVDDYFEVHVRNNSEYACATKQTYSSTINHLNKFLEVNGRKRMLVAEADSEFIKEFDEYLINRSVTEKKGLRKNSANKYHTKMKTILYKAVDTNLLEKNPYKDVKFKSEPGQLTYLTSNELKRLEEHDLCNNESLERVRDIFLFSVYTGLRHSDAVNLKAENIELEGKRNWIIYKQQKTGEHNKIPMLQKALELYNKYEEERKITGYVLPRLSHQKLNMYLKTIANLVGIKKQLSHHVARHTAATTIFMQNGISLESTGKLLGHKSIKSTQIYAKVTNLMLKEAAQKLDQLL